MEAFSCMKYECVSPVNEGLFDYCYCCYDTVIGHIRTFIFFHFSCRPYIFNVSDVVAANKLNVYSFDDTSTIYILPVACPDL